MGIDAVGPISPISKVQDFGVPVQLISDEETALSQRQLAALMPSLGSDINIQQHSDNSQMLAMRTMVNSYTKVTPAMLLYGEIQKSRYDAKSTQITYTTNDLVLKQRNATGGKLEPKWEGPFVIETEYANGTYIIKDRYGGRDLVHGDRLKKYYRKANLIPQVVPVRLRSNLHRFEQ
ncbi:hypothetical protein BB560_004527 [Smittium megazygosporum]|uniref:Integrase zinc-binding domain-containing protein n=1 Tax=Smittium megazygosporum TaxID=133381 RepID=A0A2T9Z8Z7_9FUNG|nr:hypothetical protein BB560_004527 [Smittium megazygosporum]